jgi:glycosyltransferase involved in cell wall biosynthesis
MSDNLIKPGVSVIMAVYNTEKYLSQCIESILHQTFKEFEVIAVDDGSTDNSLRILREFSKKDPRIKIYRNKKNKGVSSSLNHAIKHCTASIVVRMDSDDIMLPDRIEKQYKYIKANPDCVLLGGQVKFINENNEIRGNSCFPVSDYTIKKNLFYFQTVADSTILFNRKLIPDHIFYFSDNLAVAEGLDLYLRLQNYGKYANIRDTLVLLRDRPDSLSKKIKRNFKVIRRVRSKAIKEYGVKAPLLAGFITFFQGAAVMLLPSSLVIRFFNYLRKFFIKE